MEDCSSSIFSFCSQLRSCCSHLESSCTSLRTAVEQPPSTLPSSNLHPFLTKLLDRVFSTTKAVENLEAMTTGTISFGELLGHCTELYKQNEATVSELEEKLKQYGYVPEEVDEARSEDVSNSDLAEDISYPPLEDKTPPLHCWSETTEDVVAKITEAQKALSLPPFGDSTMQFSNGLERRKVGHYCSLSPETLSVQELGLSAAGLALIAQESSPALHTDMYSSAPHDYKSVCMEEQPIAANDEAAAAADLSLVTAITREEYNNSPIWLKMQITFEDLNDFVEKVSAIKMRKAKGDLQQSRNRLLDLADIQSLGAGVKVKPCLLFLVRVGRLKTGHENGTTVYHIMQS